MSSIQLRRAHLCSSGSGNEEGAGSASYFELVVGHVVRHSVVDQILQQGQISDQPQGNSMALGLFDAHPTRRHMIKPLVAPAGPRLVLLG